MKGFTLFAGLAIAGTGLLIEDPVTIGFGATAALGALALMLTEKKAENPAQVDLTNKLVNNIYIGGMPHAQAANAPTVVLGGLGLVAFTVLGLAFIALPVILTALAASPALVAGYIAYKRFSKRDEPKVIDVMPNPEIGFVPDEKPEQYSWSLPVNSEVSK